MLRQHFFGADSDEVWRACKTVGEMCNLLAMTYLQQEDFAMVLELLKKAEILTERDPPGRAVTFNNLACYYRRLVSHPLTNGEVIVIFIANNMISYKIRSCIIFKNHEEECLL